MSGMHLGSGNTFPNPRPGNRSTFRPACFSHSNCALAVKGTYAKSIYVPSDSL